MKLKGIKGIALLMAAVLLLVTPLAAIAEWGINEEFRTHARYWSEESTLTAQVAESEVDQARRAGQAWVDKIAVIDAEMSEWQGAHLTSPQPFHNPKGEVIAYMFGIEENGKTVGRVLVGSSAYGYSILEASEGPLLSIPARGEVSSILRKEHGLQIAEARMGEPMLLLLNILRGFYAVWELEGQVAGINLVSHDSFVAPRLEDIRSSMPSPLEYKAAKRATSQSAPGMALQSANWGSGEIPHAGGMKGDWPDPAVSGIPPKTRQWWCGPSSATTIALWKRDFDGDGKFPAWQEGQDPGADIIAIYDGFDDWNMGEVTMWWNWYWGFLGYAGHRGEHFTLVWRNTYWEIVHDIDNDWPLGLMGSMTGPPGEPKSLHWVAVKEYFWIGGNDYLVIVADTWWAGTCNHTANRRFLCWHALNDPAFVGPWVWAVRDTD
ncbi:MAG: hypothetical protein DDT25_00507 [Chloroflexi bacterium]|nr:hypothetical protein [Chloroflexota bacterium]